VSPPWVIMIPFSRHGWINWPSMKVWSKEPLWRRRKIPESLQGTDTFGPDRRGSHFRLISKSSANINFSHRPNSHENCWLFFNRAQPYPIPTSRYPWTSRPNNKLFRKPHTCTDCGW
jgi:hypothetical protein